MRARNLKPGFFLNEDLVDLPALARLLFAGLWCMADREGRLEDRPRRIKLEVLPADDCDVDALLTALAGKGLIVRYEVDGGRYIAIPNFGKHQNPHQREAASTIPEPPQAQPRPDLGTAKAMPSPAESPFLNPPSLNPESPSLKVKHSSAVTDASAAAEVVAIYHEECPSLPRVLKVTEPRKKRIAKLIADVQDVRAYFHSIEASDFLTGRHGGRGWKADFDWLLEPRNVTKIREGSYSNRNGPPGKAAKNVSAALALVAKYEAEEAEHVTV